MSSILKALKKLEDDRVARRPEQLNIDSDILKSDSSHRFSPSSVIIVSLLLLAAGSGATYMLMRSAGTPERTDIIKSPGVTSVQSPLPASNQSAIKSEQLPETVVIVPANPQKPLRAEADRKSQKPAPVTAGKASPAAATAKPVLPPKPAIAPKPVEQAIVTEQTIPTAPTAPVAKAVPTLRVNGIAFEAGGSVESVAIINGLPVTRGSLVEGVKVEEIHKNSVDFSFNGEKIEIPLGQSNK